MMSCHKSSLTFVKDSVFSRLGATVAPSSTSSSFLSDPGHSSSEGDALPYAGVLKHPPAEAKKRTIRAPKEEIKVIVQRQKLIKTSQSDTGGEY